MLFLHVFCLFAENIEVENRGKYTFEKNLETHIHPPSTC